MDQILIYTNHIFFYNRTFGKKDFEGTDYQGSYSRDFRPDYTLAIFPSTYKEDQAIKIGEVSFIHFDAKYRVTDITSFCGTEGNIAKQSIVRLEGWTAEIEKSELVSAVQLVEALKKNSDYNLENPQADFYYLVTLKNIKWKGLSIADTEQKIEHDIKNLVGSPYSPKVIEVKS